MTERKKERLVTHLLEGESSSLTVVIMRVPIRKSRCLVVASRFDDMMSLIVCPDKNVDPLPPPTFSTQNFPSP